VIARLSEVESGLKALGDPGNHSNRLVDGVVPVVCQGFGQLGGLFGVVETDHLVESRHVLTKDPQIEARTVTAVGAFLARLRGVTERISLRAGAVDPPLDTETCQQFLNPDQQFLGATAKSDVPGSHRHLVHNATISVEQTTQESDHCFFGRLENRLWDNLFFGKPGRDAQCI